MKQYNDALEFILKNGVKSEDRTGEGTLSYFGYEMRFDLQKGFPAVTTKKLAWKSVVSELLWFIEGSSDERRLAEILYGTRDESKTTIWTDNAKKQGKDLGFQNNELGPVYGYHWRYIYNNECFPVKMKKQKDFKLELTNEQKEKEEYNPYFLNIGMLGEYPTKKQTLIDKRLKKLWEQTLTICYDKESKLYNQKLKVSERWFVLSNFIEDVKKLEGWSWFLRNEKVVLYTNYYGVNNTYNPETTVFCLKEHVKQYEKNEKPIKVLNKSIPTRFYISKEDYRKESPNGKKSFYENEGFVIRHQFPVDQIKTLINQIKKDPNSRRLLLTSLDVGSISKASLPPCHTFAQFYVRDGKLSCKMYQRSADFFLGVPFNIASYSLFVHMIAQVCGLEVGEFIHTFGDAHIYLNHIEQTHEQLSRVPYELPKLKINKDIKNIEDFKMEDFELLNYKHHAKIEAKMAV